MLAVVNSQSLEADSEPLLDRLHRMHARVTELGLERYDHTDVLSHPWFLRLQLGKRRFNGYYVFRLVEYFSPLLCRRVLGVRPTLTPTTMYHLGLTYLAWESAEPGRSSHFGALADSMCDRALKEQLPGDFTAWKHPYDMHKADWARAELLREGIPDSCCHHTTRLGLLLLDVGLRHQNKQYVLAARSAANALLHYHNWQFHDDGTCALSYYPETYDETINTGAEAAVLLASLPSSLRTEEHVSRALGLTKMVIHEQGQQGQWKYATRRHEQRLGVSGEPDNHHTAMNLTSLAELLDAGIFALKERRAIRTSLELGLRYYMDTFVRENGYCIHEVGLARQAEIAGYCEGVTMLAKVLDKCQIQDVALRKRCLTAMPLMLAQAYESFYDPQTGDVASSRRFGTRYHVRSIRWGAGLLMQATVAAMVLRSVSKAA